MELREAVALIEAAVGGRAGAWADVGAGTGTFTRALVQLLGPESRIYAIDRDSAALSELSQWVKSNATNVIPVRADFTTPFELPGLGNMPLDGLLLANALHFVREAESVLARLVSMLRPGGRVVFVEYDQRDANRWVPYPISRARLTQLTEAAGLSAPTVTATQPSAYRGILYVAVADRTPA